MEKKIQFDQINKTWVMYHHGIKYSISCKKLGGTGHNDSVHAAKSYFKQIRCLFWKKFYEQLYGKIIDKE